MLVRLGPLTAAGWRYFSESANWTWRVSLRSRNLHPTSEREQVWYKILNREYSQKDGREELFERERHSEPVAGWHSCVLACEALRWEKQTFYCPISSLLLKIGLR